MYPTHLMLNYKSIHMFIIVLQNIGRCSEGTRSLSSTTQRLLHPGGISQLVHVRRKRLYSKQRQRFQKSPPPSTTTTTTAISTSFKSTHCQQNQPSRLIPYHRRPTQPTGRSLQTQLNIVQRNFHLTPQPILLTSPISTGQQANRLQPLHTIPHGNQVFKQKHKRQLQQTASRCRPGQQIHPTTKGWRSHQIQI